MVCGAVRGWAELNSLQLIFGDYFRLIHILHEFKIRSTSGKSMALLKMIVCYMLEHRIPASTGIDFSEVDGTPLAICRWRKSSASEVAEYMCFPHINILELVITWKDVEETVKHNWRLIARTWSHWQWSDEITSAIRFENVDIHIDFGSYVL